MIAARLNPARAVFIDSGAYLAVADSHDAHHPTAEAVLDRLSSERWRLYTTNFVVAETHALVLARQGRWLASRVLHEIDSSTGLRIIRVSEADELHAREIIDQYDDKAFTLTDATSFAVMERLGIRHAFTFDRHFSQYGFVLLAADESG